MADVIGALPGAAWAEVAVYVIASVLLLVLLRGWSQRRKSRPHYGQTMGHPVPPDDLPQKDDAPEKMSMGKRIFAICFLSIWLTVWTAGCYMALVTAAGLSYGEEGFIFMRIWLAGAIPAWFFVAWTLFRLLRGDHIEMHFDGDADGGD